ncbi:MAG: adenylate/guanylate cyclase domain-containing protein [Spirochaetes bacterium]|nr:adenylate/guanylate cyclase domain-containing protein [Spirochaetota bacterium]
MTLALVAASRFSLAIVTGKACDSLIHKAWLVGSLVASSAIVAAAIMAAVVGPSSYEAAEAGAMVVLALHAVAATPFFALAAGGAPAAPRLIGGSAPWGLVWASAAALSAARLLGFDAPDALDGYAAIAVVAADGVMGLAVLLGVMLELAKPAPEDTALDDYALKMDAYTAKVGASIKRFIPTEFLQHLEKADFFDLKLGDHVKKDMTIFFSDIRAFTEMSERLTTEESFSFINSYLARVVPVINDHGGFVDKYMGDGIMALFAEHGGADQAVESAVEMQKKMVEYNGHRAKVNYRPISMGIGIHTGQLMLGVVGVADRMEGTVISDAVNLSSRLQSIAKAFNIPLVISERTFMQLEDPGKYKYRFIGKVRVKGKDAPVSVFEIFDGLPEELFERKMKSNTFFEQGMLAYYQKDYSQGVFYFKRALENVPDDGASRFYLETCLRKAIAPKPAEK